MCPVGDNLLVWQMERPFFGKLVVYEQVEMSLVRMEEQEGKCWTFCSCPDQRGQLTCHWAVLGAGY